MASTILGHYVHTYMKLVVCERYLNVQMSKQRGKKLAVVQGPLGSGGLSHGTTGTVIDPALGVVAISGSDDWRRYYQ